MGNFLLEIEAVGGHGCQREVKDGGVILTPCGGASCPDCAFVAFVDQLKKSSNNVLRAAITHWPATATTVYDAVVPADGPGARSKRVRRGSF